ncbi:sulfurtransferase, partial [Azospirillum brasilense]|nr:sulfurtransferase [Azospirillum brasilense]
MTDSHTTLTLPGPIVPTGWLAERLGQPGLRVLDSSWFMPGSGRDPAAEFLERHIPGAVRIDIDDVAQPDTHPLPHMVPDEATFAAKVGALGGGGGDTVIVYDSAGMATAAARVWWMFRLFGHGRVAVLDGGLPKWIAEGRSLESGPANPAPAAFTAALRPGLLSRADDVTAQRRPRVDHAGTAPASTRPRGAVAQPGQGSRQQR